MEFLWLKALHILPLPIYTRAFVSALMVSICQFVVSLLLAHWFFNAALLLIAVHICLAEFYSASQAAFNLLDQYRDGYFRFLFRIVAYPRLRTTIRGGYIAMLPGLSFDSAAAPCPSFGSAAATPPARADIDAAQSFWLQSRGDGCTGR